MGWRRPSTESLRFSKAAFCHLTRQPLATMPVSPYWLALPGKAFRPQTATLPQPLHHADLLWHRVISARSQPLVFPSSIHGATTNNLSARSEEHTSELQSLMRTS